MKIEWKTCFRIAVSIFLLYLAVTYWTTAAGLLSTAFAAALPLLLGCGIAYVINIPMTFYEKHYFTKSTHPMAAATRRPVCMIAAFLTILAAAALIIGLVVPQLGECIRLILAEFPGLMEKAVTYAKDQKLMPEKVLQPLLEIDWKSQLSGIIEKLGSGLGNVVGGVISVVASVFSGIVTALISIIFSMYLLISKDTLCEETNRLLRRIANGKWNEKIHYVTSILNDSFRRYIVGQCTEAVILGVLCTVGMLIFRFPYALMIGALVAFTALIPVAGAYIGAGVGAFMILTESPMQALLFLVFILILQQVEGNLIYPKVVGTSIGLPGLWVLAAVTIGGGISGVLGMLLGVPIAAALYRILREDLHRFEAVQAPAPAEEKTEAVPAKEETE